MTAKVTMRLATIFSSIMIGEAAYRRRRAGWRFCDKCHSLLGLPTSQFAQPMGQVTERRAINFSWDKKADVSMSHVLSLLVANYVAVVSRVWWKVVQM